VVGRGMGWVVGMGAVVGKGKGKGKVVSSWVGGEMVRVNCNLSTIKNKAFVCCGSEGFLQNSMKS
jgi:hypothetical protein